MNEADKAYLEEVLATLGKYNKVAEGKVRRNLKELDNRQKLMVVEAIRQADASAYFWQGTWCKLARAWLLARLSFGGFLPGYFLEPSAQEWADLQNQLKTSSEPSLQVELNRIVSGVQTLEDIAKCRIDNARSAWDPKSFTKPTAHEASQYVYLIHAMRPLAGFGNVKDAHKKRFDYLKRTRGTLIETTDNGQWGLRCAELYLREPEVLKTELLSCSVIDPSHTNTYGDFCFGFILTVPTGNIVAASTADMNASNLQNKARADKLAELDAPGESAAEVHDFLEMLLGWYRTPPAPPITILNGTAAKGHNEVLVLGSLGSTNPIEIAGLFMKVTPKKKLWKSFVADDAKYDLSKHIKACSKTLAVPIVDIVEDGPEESEIDFAAWKGN
jgi:hypothetical protein